MNLFILEAILVLTYLSWNLFTYPWTNVLVLEFTYLSWNNKIWLELIKLLFQLTGWTRYVSGKHVLWNRPAQFTTFCPPEHFWHSWHGFTLSWPSGGYPGHGSVLISDTALDFVGPLFWPIYSGRENNEASNTCYSSVTNTPVSHFRSWEKALVFALNRCLGNRKLTHILMNW